MSGGFVFPDYLKRILPSVFWVPTDKCFGNLVSEKTIILIINNKKIKNTYVS